MEQLLGGKEPLCSPRDGDRSSFITETVPGSPAATSRAQNSFPHRSVPFTGSKVSDKLYWVVFLGFLVGWNPVQRAVTVLDMNLGSATNSPCFEAGFALF